MKHQFITVEDLRAAILAAAHDCDLERMHEIVLAYHRLTGQEEGEEPEVGTASRPKLAQSVARRRAATIKGPLQHSS